MRRKSKREAKAAQAEVAQATPTSPPPGGRFVSELQVFDGKGHAAVMQFYTDSKGRVVQKLRKGRDFEAHLPQTHR